jgi:hypothetical protein
VTLPSSYRSILALAEPQGEDDRHFWLGDCGFILPPTADSPPDWIRRLSELRWPGMHPDLIPFAVDGMENRWCFYRGGRPDSPHAGAVVYWMYQTYRAIPVADSFDDFVDFIGLSAAASAWRGDDAVIDMAHWHAVVRPMLVRLGRPVDSIERQSRDNHDTASIHRMMTQLHPRASGSLLARALNLTEPEHAMNALSLCERALEAFPEFAAAESVRVELLDRVGTREDRAEALLRLFRLPLVYGGDSHVPCFPTLSPLDITRLVEQLATDPWANEKLLDEPVFDMLLHDDPTSPQAWLTAAVETANANDLEMAVTMAQNALLFGYFDDWGVAAMTLLGELYEALGWDAHLDITRLDAEIRERRTRNRKR